MGQQRTEVGDGKGKEKGPSWCVTELSYRRSFSVHKRGLAFEVSHKQESQ